MVKDFPVPFPKLKGWRTRIFNITIGLVTVGVSVVGALQDNISYLDLTPNTRNMLLIGIVVFQTIGNVILREFTDSAPGTNGK
jgi:hypothetical protein